MDGGRASVSSDQLTQLRAIAAIDDEQQRVEAVMGATDLLQGTVIEDLMSELRSTSPPDASQLAATLVFMMGIREVWQIMQSRGSPGPRRQ
jgi:hypothetical protein